MRRWVGSRAEKVSLGTSIVDRHAASERVALICVGKDGSERRLTYRELSEASNRFANLLQRLGVEPGDRVAGLMPRGPEVIIAIIGTLEARRDLCADLHRLRRRLDPLPARSLPGKGSGDASGRQKAVAVRTERADHLRFAARRRACRRITSTSQPNCRSSRRTSRASLAPATIRRPSSIRPDQRASRRAAASPSIFWRRSGLMSSTASIFGATTSSGRPEILAGATGLSAISARWRPARR